MVLIFGFLLSTIPEDGFLFGHVGLLKPFFFFLIFKIKIDT